MLLAPWLFAIQLAAPSEAFDVRAAVDDPCVMNAFAQLLKRGEGILGRLEAAAFLVRDEDGSLRMVLWPRTEFSRKETFRGVIPPGTVAIAHTHPPTMERPSRGDEAEAARLGLTIMVVTYWQIWAVEPSRQHVPITRRGDWSHKAERNACTANFAELPHQISREVPRPR